MLNLLANAGKDSLCQNRADLHFLANLWYCITKIWYLEMALPLFPPPNRPLTSVLLNQPVYRWQATLHMAFWLDWRALVTYGQNFGPRASVNCTGLELAYFVHITSCISVLENANFLMIEHLFPIIFNRLNMADISGRFCLCLWIWICIYFRE